MDTLKVNGRDMANQEISDIGRKNIFKEENNLTVLEDCNNISIL